MLDVIIVLAVFAVIGAFVEARRRFRSPVDRILAKKKRENTWFYRSLRKEEQRLHAFRHEWFPS
jgi:hypothetical protein